MNHATEKLAAVRSACRRVSLAWAQHHAQPCDWIWLFTHRKMTVPVAFALLLAGFGSGCGTPSARETSSPPPAAPTPAVVSVRISPQFAELKRGANSSFYATAFNAKDTSVTWSIKEGSAGGEITSAGVYTAPDTDGDYHIIATSNEDNTKSATANVMVSASVFNATGSMIVGRGGHTATLLPDGQVFIAGGSDNTGKIASGTELFDPVQGAFHSAGMMTRVEHTATRLANGDVLFAGGNTGSSDGLPSLSASAELLKAGTGVLEPTGSMILPRSDHTATLLQDGRVLITGGLIPSGTTDIPTETAELYDPASGTFSQAQSMSEPRASHSATLLSSGKVLILGNRSAELYDPAANTFTVTSSRPAPRFDSTATTLADGRVLITGGDINYADMYIGPSELFDPVTEQFTLTGTLEVPRWGHTGTLLPDGTVLIVGGLLDPWGDNGATQTTEIYDPATGSFRPGPSMLYLRAGHIATLLSDGSVLVTGGYIPTAEIYR